MSNSLSLLIKPASSACNLRCQYCFYADVSENRSVKNTGIMKQECTESLVKNAFATKAERVFFAFQGGEPTVAGLDYFRHFAATVKEHSGGAKFTYSLQTNGTLLNDQWAEFFYENKFLIGLSLDGDRDIQDFFRPDAKGAGSYKATLRAARIMDAHKVDYNILTVVTDTTAKHISKIYNHFKALGFRFLQFIPCIADFEGTAPDAPKLTVKKYGEFLIRLFDLWLADFKKGNYISIRHIDNYVQLLAGNAPENCAMRGECGVYFVVEGDGSLYPCDFYCIDKYKLRNVFDEKPFEVIPPHDEFLKCSQKLSGDCRVCEYYFICRGGCRRDREPGLTQNKYCTAYKAFFERALKDMRIIADMQPKRR